MGPTWVLSAPDGPHVGPMNLAIRVAVRWSRFDKLRPEQGASPLTTALLNVFLTDGNEPIMANIFDCIWRDKAQISEYKWYQMAIFVFAICIPPLTFSDIYFYDQCDILSYKQQANLWKMNILSHFTESREIICRIYPKKEMQPLIIFRRHIIGDPGP